jgi:hypothetical protein
MARCVLQNVGQLLGDVRLQPSDGSTDAEICIRLLKLVPAGNSSTNGTANYNSTIPPGLMRTAAAAAAGEARNGQGRDSNSNNNGSPSNDSNDSSFMFRLANIRFVPVGVIGKASRPDDSNGKATAAAAGAAAIDAVPAGMPNDVIGALGTAAEPASYTHFKPSADMLEFERLVRQEAIADGIAEYTRAQVGAREAAAVVPGSRQDQWRQLQRKYRWMEGQMVFRSLYRPCPDSGPPGCVETCG